MIETITQISPTLIRIERKPERHEWVCLEAAGAHDDLCHDEGCPVCYPEEGPEERPEPDPDYRYGEPFRGDDLCLYVERTDLATGDVEVLPCEVHETDVTGWDELWPHDPILYLCDITRCDLPLTRDILRGDLERGPREDHLVQLRQVVGTVRHPLLWIDLATGDVYDVKARGRRGAWRERICVQGPYVY